MGYLFVTDLLRAVRNVLQPAHGGTGDGYGRERVAVKGLNSTGSTIPLWTLVQLSGTTNTPKVKPVTALDSEHVLGVCVGYFDGFTFVEDDAPDGREVAVLTMGIVRVLIESSVTRDEYAYPAATDGTIYSDATLTTGAFGRIVTSADVANGDDYAWVMLPLTNGGGGGGGGATFGTPALTLSTTNSAGVSGDAIATDSTVAVFDATVPVTQAFSDSAATGSAGKAARRDHKHGMPASGVPSFATPAIVLGTAAAAGSAGTVIRSDSTIVAFDATAPTTQAFGDAAATGSAAVAAKRDHKHGMMANPLVGAAGALEIVASSPVAGVLTDVEMPFAGTWTSWRVINDAAGSITYDLWLDTYANFPPVVGDSKVGANKPKTTAAALAQDAGSMTGWTTAFAAGDILRVNIDSASGIGRSTLSLRYVRT